MRNPLFSLSDHLPSAAQAVEFTTSAAVKYVVSQAFQAGIIAIIAPAELFLSVAAAAATYATTYIIMVTAKMTLNGFICAGSQVINGTNYFLYKPKSKSEEWDDCDEVLLLEPAKASNKT